VTFDLIALAEHHLDEHEIRARATRHCSLTITLPDRSVDHPSHPDDGALLLARLQREHAVALAIVSNTCSVTTAFVHVGHAGTTLSLHTNADNAPMKPLSRQLTRTHLQSP